MRFVQRRLPHAERLRGDGDTPAVQRLTRDREALILGAQPLILRDDDIGQDQIHAAQATDAERVDAGLATDARAIERQEKRRDATPARAGLGRREHDREARRLAVGDPHLVSVETVAAVDARRDGLLVRRVGAGVRLGQRECADGLTRGEPRQPLLLLRVAAGTRDDFGDERVLDGEDDRHRGAPARDGLDRQRVADVIELPAAKGFRHAQAEVAIRRRLLDHRRREEAGVVDASRLWRHRLARERVGGGTNGFLLVSQREIHEPAPCTLHLHLAHRGPHHARCDLT